jgi:hypothetical protein
VKGGGKVEAEVIRAAQKVLHAERPRLLDLELTEAAGYLCSGHLRIYPEPALLIVGAGTIYPLGAWRITIEEEFLRRELPGYEAYRKRVRYRVIPLVW